MSLPKKPAHLPPLPKGYVYLGKGKSFKLPPDNHFKGAACFGFNDANWCNNSLKGNCLGLHYSAPANSSIVKLNTAAPKANKKPKRVKPKYHRFVISVKTDVTNTRALTAILTALASRNPDGCEMTVTHFQNKARK